MIEPNLTLLFIELYFGKFVFLLIVLDVLQLKAILAEPFYQFFLALALQQEQWRIVKQQIQFLDGTEIQEDGEGIKEK